MSETEVAQLIGLDGAAYRRIEAGVTDPDVTMITALAQALDVAPADLHGTAPWETDYVSAVLQHAQPMSEEDVARAADILTERRTP